jgi:hypothetical protein
MRWPSRNILALALGVCLLVCSWLVWAPMPSYGMVGYPWHIYWRNGSYSVGDPAPAGAEYVGYIEVWRNQEPWPKTGLTPFERVSLTYVQYPLDYPAWSEQYKMLPDTSSLDWFKQATLSPELNFEVPEFNNDVSTLGTTAIRLSSAGPRRIMSFLSLALGASLLLVGRRLSWLDHRRMDRRSRGECEGCGYDRRSLTPETACPECGKPPRSPP